jgi:hypothetical protein
MVWWYGITVVLSSSITIISWRSWIQFIQLVSLCELISIASSICSQFKADSVVFLSVSYSHDECITDDSLIDNFYTFQVISTKFCSKTLFDSTQRELIDSRRNTLISLCLHPSLFFELLAQHQYRFSLHYSRRNAYFILFASRNTERSVAQRVVYEKEMEKGVGSVREWRAQCVRVRAVAWFHPLPLL